MLKAPKKIKFKSLHLHLFNKGLKGYKNTQSYTNKNQTIASEQREVCKKNNIETSKRSKKMIFSTIIHVKKPLQTRMGKGKGKHDKWVAPVKSGITLVEILVAVLLLLLLLSQINVNRTRGISYKNPFYITTRGMHRAKDTGLLLKVVNTVNQKLGFSVNVEKSATTMIEQRSMSTFVGVRRKLAIKQTHPPEVYAPDGVPIHHAIDCSGQKHAQIADLDSIKDGKIKVYASFTTSQSPHKGEKPTLVANVTFSGQKKNQYAHIYPQGRWIGLEEIEIAPDLHEALKENPEFLKFLSDVASKTKLDPNVSVGELTIIYGLFKKC